MIHITEAGYEFILAEIDAVHRACDKLGVPSEAEEGVPLSMAQRVEALVEHCRACDIEPIQP